jgi:hypothetical protein
MVGENAAGTGTVCASTPCAATPNRPASPSNEVPPIENDFWRFYLLTP